MLGALRLKLSKWTWMPAACLRRQLAAVHRQPGEKTEDCPLLCPARSRSSGCLPALRGIRTMLSRLHPGLQTLQILLTRATSPQPARPRGTCCEQAPFNSQKLLVGEEAFSWRPGKCRGGKGVGTLQRSPRVTHAAYRRGMAGHVSTGSGARLQGRDSLGQERHQTGAAH